MSRLETSALVISSRKASFSRFRSVMSRVTFVKPVSSPLWPRSAVITTLAQNCEPSLRTRQAFFLPAAIGGGKPQPFLRLSARHVFRGVEA